MLRNLRRPFLWIHRFFLKFKLQLLPDHYYSSVANIDKLKKTREIWAKRSSLPGIFYNLEDQAHNLTTICTKYQNEYIGNKNYNEGVTKKIGPGFGYIEAQALHSVIRYYKPKKIIEIGSGVSTYCSYKALELNKLETSIKPELICIEPNPHKKLIDLEGVKIITKKVQEIPFDFFSQLKKGDILFVDSTHTVKPGSDVNYIILEILPRLQSGVIVHFHDIFLPYDYQRNILTDYFQWCETSLLRAYLIHNNKAQILFSLSMLHYDRKDFLKKNFPEYKPQQDNDGLTYGLYPPFNEIKEHFPASTFILIK